MELWSVLVWLLLKSNLPEPLLKKLQFFFLEPTTTQVSYGMTECLCTGTFYIHQFPGYKAFQRPKMPCSWPKALVHTLCNVIGYVVSVVTKIKLKAQKVTYVLKVWKFNILFYLKKCLTYSTHPLYQLGKDPVRELSLFEVCFFNKYSSAFTAQERFGGWETCGRKKEELHWEVCLSTEIQRCLTEEESLLENRNGCKEYPVLQP